MQEATSAGLNSSVPLVVSSSVIPTQAAVASAQPLPQPDVISEQYSDAIASLISHASVLADLGRYEEALSTYEELLALRPTISTPSHMRGLVLEHLQRPEDALASYDKAISVAPDSSDALYNRGNILADLARFEEALAKLRPGACDQTRCCAHSQQSRAGPGRIGAVRGGAAEL